MSPWQRVIRGLDGIAGSRTFKVAAWIGAAIPLALLGYDAWLTFTERDPMALGTDPSLTLFHKTGQTGITLLLLALTVTPVRRIFHINRLQNVRRMLGVWSFAYIAIHLTLYLTLDQLCYSWSTCNGAAIWKDLLRRPYIFMGQAGFLILLVLAITSTNGWMRRLKRNWGRLHKLVYLAAIAGIIHFIWIQKKGFAKPLPWMVWLGVVFGVRIFYAIRRRIGNTKSTLTA